MRRTFRSTLPIAAAALGLVLAAGAWAEPDEERSGHSDEETTSMEESSSGHESSSSASEDMGHTQPGTSGEAAAAGTERAAEARKAAKGSASSVEKRVQEKLDTHEGLRDVRVGNTVTLEGEVSSQGEREEAARLAGEVEGVTAVENRIAVSGGPGAGDVSSPPPGQESGSAAPEARGRSGEMAEEESETRRSPSQRSSDPSESEPSGAAPQQP